MSTTAGINPESVAAALKHLADPTLHFVTRDSPPPSLPERAAAMLMAQAAGVIERLLEEAAKREAEAVDGPAPGDVRSLRERLLDLPPSVYRDHAPATDTPLTDMSLLAILRDPSREAPPREQILDYIERLMRRHDEAHRYIERLLRRHDEAHRRIDGPQEVVTLTEHDVNPDRIIGPPSTILPNTSFVVSSKAIAALAAQVNHLHRLWTEAKDAGQRHADELDEARRRHAYLESLVAGDSTIAHMLILLREGRRVRRRGWNGKGMWLALVQPEAWHADMVIKPDGATKLPWVGMRTADGGFVPWLCSQTDLLATDWELAE